MTNRSIYLSVLLCSFLTVVPTFAQETGSAATLEKILALPCVTGERV